MRSKAKMKSAKHGNKSFPPAPWQEFIELEPKF